GNAGWFSPKVLGTRLELNAFGGASGYRRFHDPATNPVFEQQYSRFSLEFGRARLQWGSASGGAWLADGVGAIRFQHKRRPTDEAAGGVWGRRGDSSGELSLSSSHAGDTSFMDVVATIRGKRQRLQAFVSAGD